MPTPCAPLGRQGRLRKRSGLNANAELWETPRRGFLCYSRSPPRPWDEVPDARLRLVPLDEVRDVRVLPCPKHEGASSRSFHRGRGRVLTASMLAAALIALLPVPAAIADDSA